MKQTRQEARRPRPTVTYGDCDRPAAPTQVEARNSGSDHEMEGSAQEGSAQEGPCSAQQPLENVDSAFEEMVASVDVSVQQPQEMVPARLEKAGSPREMEAEVVAAAIVDSAQEPQETEVVAAAIVDSAQEPQETLVNQKPQETPVKAAEAGSSVKVVDADHAESGLPVEASRGEAAATSSAASSNTHSHWLKDMQNKSAKGNAQMPSAKRRRTQKGVPTAGQRRLDS